MLLVSFLLVIRGHNHPGGGFIGALIATSAMGLYILAYDTRASQMLPAAISFMGLGLALLIVACVTAMTIHQPLLTGKWLSVVVFNQPIKIGTPLIFDFGVYFLVFGSLYWLMVELVQSREAC